jgi:hypothetical protein
MHRRSGHIQRYPGGAGGERNPAQLSYKRLGYRPLAHLPATTMVLRQRSAWPRLVAPPFEPQDSGDTILIYRDSAFVSCDAHRPKVVNDNYQLRQQR